jgi:hypothetical protein
VSTWMICAWRRITWIHPEGVKASPSTTRTVLRLATSSEAIDFSGACFDCEREGSNLYDLERAEMKIVRADTDSRMRTMFS